MTYQELLEYLEELRQKTGGNIAGLSDDTDLSSLSMDDLNKIRASIAGAAGA